MQTRFFLIDQPERRWPSDSLARLASLGCSGLVLQSDDVDALVQQLPAWRQRLAQVGLALHGASLAADVHEAELQPQAERIGRLIQPLSGWNIQVMLNLVSSSLHDKPSAPRADSRAARLVRQLAQHAHQADVRLALLPQPGQWMQRIEDAARIAMRVNHPCVGLSLDGRMLDLSQPHSLQPRLHLALPRLWSLVLPDPAQNSQQAASLWQTVSKLGYQGAVGWLCPQKNNLDDWIEQAAANWQRGIRQQP